MVCPPFLNNSPSMIWKIASFLQGQTYWKFLARRRSIKRPMQNHNETTSPRLAESIANTCAWFRTVGSFGIIRLRKSSSRLDLAEIREFHTPRHEEKNNEESRNNVCFIPCIQKQIWSSFIVVQDWDRLAPTLCIFTPYRFAAAVQSVWWYSSTK